MSTYSLGRDYAGVARAEPAEAPSGRMWAIMLAASLVLLICIRFFSENLRLVPPLVQYIDVPITILIAICAVLAFVRRGFRLGNSRFGVVLFMFLTVALVSGLVNASRVNLLPMGMFIFNFIAPLICVVATVHAQLRREDVRLVVRTFFWLGMLQLAIGIFYDVPLFLASNNPDDVSGTFGQNAYQFTYFLGVWLLYVLGGMVVGSESRRRGQGTLVALATLAVFGLFYAAQYRAMLVFFTLVLLIALWVSPARVSSRVMLTLVISVVSVATLMVIGTAFPNLKLLKVFDLFSDSTPIVESGKVQAVENVAQMYVEMPQAAVVGSGPATFSSRAYITFASKPRPGKEAIGVLAVSLRGGQLYSTDVARRYVETINTKPIQGGTTVSSPMSSYTSLAAEVGPVGLVVYLSAYLMALYYSYRRLKVYAGSRDRLGTQLAFACFGGLLLLLVQALFDNWLEVTRVAMPLWILVGLLYALETTGPVAAPRALAAGESEDRIPSRRGTL